MKIKTRSMSEAISSVDLAVFDCIEVWGPIKAKSICRPTDLNIKDVNAAIRRLASRGLIVKYDDDGYIFNSENKHAVALVRAELHYLRSLVLDDFNREMKNVSVDES